MTRDIVSKQVVDDDGEKKNQGGNKPVGMGRFYFIIFEGENDKKGGKAAGDLVGKR